MWVPSLSWHRLEIIAAKDSWWCMIGRKYPFLLLKKLWGGSRVCICVETMYLWKAGLVRQQHGMILCLRQTQWSESDRSKRRLLSLFLSLLIHIAISLRTNTQIISGVYQGYLLHQKPQEKWEEGGYGTLRYMTPGNIILSEKSFIQSFTNSVISHVPSKYVHTSTYVLSWILTIKYSYNA